MQNYTKFLLPLIVLPILTLNACGTKSIEPYRSCKNCSIGPYGEQQWLPFPGQPGDYSIKNLPSKPQLVELYNVEGHMVEVTDRKTVKVDGKEGHGEGGRFFEVDGHMIEVVSPDLIKVDGHDVKVELPPIPTLPTTRKAPAYQDKGKKVTMIPVPSPWTKVRQAPAFQRDSKDNAVKDRPVDKSGDYDPDPRF
ncbi:MAG: hypothetical protein K1X44_05305 [Alphaproteobacteria bacterium]|nr:hypothetical protein [Alphaproteobacteria bacterium]